jgi:hypothetical protein
MTRLSSAASATLRQALRDANPADPGQVRHYPDHVCRLVEQFRFRAVSIDDLPWTEIDNQGDLARANRLSAG